MSYLFFSLVSVPMQKCPCSKIDIKGTNLGSLSRMALNGSVRYKMDGRTPFICLKPQQSCQKTNTGGIAAIKIQLTPMPDWIMNAKIR